MTYRDPLCAKCGHPKSNHPYRHAFVGMTEEPTEKNLVNYLRDSKGWPTLGNAAADRIEELEKENEKLNKALSVYQRERDRFKHTHPEITGAFFLTGGHGERDSNELPEYVRICPAYGCAWDQVYKKTDETFSYEGS